MSKRDNLSDYLSDLYQGIARKRENPSRNPQDFRSEIEQIETKSPEWDGKYETSDDTVIVEGGSCPVPVLVKKTVTENNKTYKASDDGADGYSEFTVAVPIPEAPEVTSEERTVTPTKSVQEITPINAAFLSKVTVEEIPDEYEIVPTWDGEALFVKSGTHTFVDNPEIFGGEGAIFEEAGLFTVRGNVPDVGEVEATCDAIYQSNGDKTLMYRVTSSVPDLTDLGIIYPLDLTAYDRTSGVWSDEGLKTVTFEDYAIMESEAAFDWFDENTEPVGVPSEPTAAVIIGDGEKLMRSGDGVAILAEGKRMPADIAFVTLPVEAAASGCDRPLGFWFMTDNDQIYDYEWDEDDNPIETYRGVKESITVPPQVQDGSATSFERLFSCYYYDGPGFMDWLGGVWAKEICGVINCAGVTSLNGLFSECIHTERICPIINTENVTDFSYMFNVCARLISTPTIDIRSAEKAYSPFAGCYALESIDLKNIKISLDLSSSSKLTVDSLVGLCYELIDTGSTKTLTIGSTNLAKLQEVYVRAIEITDEMRAEDEFIDLKKPFRVLAPEEVEDGEANLPSYVSAFKNWSLK